MKRQIQIKDDAERVYWTDLECCADDIEVLVLRFEHLMENLDLTKDDVDVYIRSLNEVKSLLSQQSFDLRQNYYNLQQFFHPELDVHISETTKYLKDPLDKTA
jgi:hypothetical protein